MANPVVGSTVNMPPQSMPALQGMQFASPWYILFRALFQRTGGGSGIPVLPVALVTAVNTSAMTPLMPGVNFVKAQGGSVQMPPQMAAGQYLVVVNVTRSAELDVWPAAGVTINGAPAPYKMNSGGALAAPTTQIFWFQDANTCYSTTLG